MSRRTNYHYDAIDDDDEEVERLRNNVNRLKNVSIQIGEEVREQTVYLRQDVDSLSDSVWGMLSNNMGGVKRLARSGSNRLVFYLLAFALFVIVVIYLINKSL